MRSIVVTLLLLATAPALAAQSQPEIIRGLSFEGNDALPDNLLATAIATTNSSWLARWPVIRGLGLGETRTFSERDFRTDVERLKLLYRASGFREVAVDTLVDRSEDGVRLTFLIEEGEPLRLVTLRFEGLENVEERDELIRDLPVSEGSVFSRFTLQEAGDTLALRLWNSGYPSAVVNTSEQVDTVARIARVTLRVSPGTPAVFGNMRIEGNEEVDSAFIFSLVTARPGRTFSQEGLYRSQRALYRSDLFRLASVSVDTSRFSAGDPVVPLMVRVEEGYSHRARASVGYATNDCFRTSAGWTARNFLGHGRVVDISGRLSKIGVGSPFGFGLENSLCSPLADDSIGSSRANYGIDLSLRRNGFLSPDNTVRLSLFSERRSEYKVYMREEIGAGMTLTRETSRQIPITLGYRISYGLTDASPVSFCQFFNACLAEDVAQLRQRRVLTTLTASAVRRRVNNLLDPTRGSIVSVEATVASRYLGSSDLQEFVRLTADATKLIQLSGNMVLAGRVRGGVILAPEVSLAGGKANFVPPEQRFYAGGPNDVRGYERNEMGPVIYVVPRSAVDFEGDTTITDPGAPRAAATGGDKLAVANLELRLPAPFMSDRFRLALFVDAGALWAQGTPARLRMTPGAGIRVASPLGPIRFDVGYNPYALEPGPVFTSTEENDLIKVAEQFQPGRDKGRWTIHFSVGHAF